MGPSDAAAGESGSMSTEPTGPVSAPTHPLPAGGPPCLGGRGVLWRAGSPQVEVSTLGYSSGLAGLSEMGARSVEQVLPYSLATGIVESAQLESSSLAAAPDTDRQQLASRQPPAAATVAATETAAAFEGPTLVRVLCLCPPVCVRVLQVSVLSNGRAVIGQASDVSHWRDR